MSFFSKLIGGKGSSSKSSGKPDKNEIAALGLDPSLFEDNDFGMGDDTGGGSDFDLDAVMASINTPTAKPKTKSSNHPASPPDYDEEDPVVELTDADMKDPSLLRELLAIGGEGIELPPEPEEENEIDEDDLKANPDLLSELEEMGYKPVVRKPKEDPALKDEFLGRIKEYKSAALAAKQSGDIELAKSYLRQYKTMESAIEEGGYGRNQLCPPIPVKTQPKAVQSPPTTPATPAVKSPQVATPPAVKSPHAPPSHPIKVAVLPVASPPAKTPATPPTPTSTPSTPSTPSKASPAQPKASASPTQPAAKPAAPPAKVAVPAKTPAVPAAKGVASPPVKATAVPPEPLPDSTLYNTKELSGMTAIQLKSILKNANLDTSAKLKTELVERIVHHKLREEGRVRQYYVVKFQERGAQYKQCALLAKTAGDIETAKNFLRTFKEIESMHANYVSGALKDPKLPGVPTYAAPENAAPVIPTKTTAPVPAKTAVTPAVPTKPAAVPAVPAKPAVATSSGPSPANCASWEEPNPLENIISNDVYEWELENLNRQIIELKMKKKPTDDLEDRKNSVMVSLQILGAKVESGQLDLDTYLGSMRKKVEEERNIAKYFLGQQKKDWAATALKRSKIMEAEIKASLE
eukprot:TRINITY_DN2269_c0_g1_i1.p1 TRINITY_DN2269_c0_g1~~TRINITY_DN2269_c0_g1_i1.p1  ORF type:complete len:635 (-),score=266.01 TRINITY_DN2269_c0_g1_i1:16-1920(-)